MDSNNYTKDDHTAPCGKHIEYSQCGEDDHESNETIRLYHFTCLLYLPMILRQGIRRGEVPVCPFGVMPNAANLTSVGSRAAQEWYNELNFLDKTKVRLEVDVHTSELTTFNEVAKTYRMPQNWIDTLDPHDQRDQWYFAFDGIPVDQIVEVGIAHDKSDSYVPIADERLEILCRQVERECRPPAFVYTQHGVMCSQVHALDSWLLDGPSATQMRSKCRQAKLGQKRQKTKDRQKKRIRKLARKQRMSNLR